MFLLIFATTRYESTPLNFSFDGKIKYGEDKKYSQIIRSEERDGEKTIVLNINQFDTTLKKERLPKS